MLSTLLSNVASFFSKYFLVSSYLPVIIFVLINSIGGYVTFEPFHDWANSQLVRTDSVSQSAFGVVVIALFTLAPAFVLSGILDSLRRILEGKWLRGLAHWFTPLEEYRLQQIDTAIAQVAVARSDFEPQWPGWVKNLADARKRSKGNGPLFVLTPAYEDIPKLISDCQRFRSQNRILPVDQLERIFKLLNDAFTKYDWSKRGPNGEQLLAEYHAQWYDLGAYEQERGPAEHMRLLTERHSSFGTDLAPTRMGNIAHAIQAYVLRRYNCNLELFWSNLQLCISKDVNANAMLQDAKARLDFLIACAWLTLLSTATWLSLLAIYNASRFWFFGIAIVGPLLSYALYRAAVEQYRAFADVNETSFDMFRFSLLREMHIALPADVKDERDLWDSLHRLANLEEGKNENLRYQNANATQTK